MRPILLAVAIAGLFAASAQAAVTADTVAFLKTIGIDPSSPDVASIADDVVSNNDVHGESLNALAAKCDANAIRRFIATRDFAHKYALDSSTPFPPPDLYDQQYLTPAELDLINAQIQKEFGAGGSGH